jgi:hypothetical protein
MEGAKAAEQRQEAISDLRTLQEEIRQLRARFDEARPPTGSAL